MIYPHAVLIFRIKLLKILPPWWESQGCWSMVIFTHSYPFHCPLVVRSKELWWTCSSAPCKDHSVSFHLIFWDIILALKSVWEGTSDFRPQPKSNIHSASLLGARWLFDSWLLIGTTAMGGSRAPAWSSLACLYLYYTLYLTYLLTLVYSCPCGLLLLYPYCVL